MQPCRRVPPQPAAAFASPLPRCRDVAFECFCGEYLTVGLVCLRKYLYKLFFEEKGVLRGFLGSWVVGKERRSWSRLPGHPPSSLRVHRCLQATPIAEWMQKLLSAPSPIPVWHPTGTTASSQPQDLQVLSSRGEELPRHPRPGRGETAASPGSPPCREVFQSRRASRWMRGAAQTSRGTH